MYCKNCGKELNDEAVVCVGCGSAVGSSKGAKKPTEGSEGKKWANSESIIGFVLSLVGGFFNIASVAWGERVINLFIFIMVGVFTSIAYSVVGLVKAAKNPEETKAFSVAGLIMASTSFVCTFVQFMILVC